MTWQRQLLRMFTDLQTLSAPCCVGFCSCFFSPGPIPRDHLRLKKIPGCPADCLDTNHNSKCYIQILEGEGRVGKPASLSCVCSMCSFLDNVYAQVSILLAWASLHCPGSFLALGFFPTRMLRVPGLLTGLSLLYVATKC